MDLRFGKVAQINHFLESILKLFRNLLESQKHCNRLNTNYLKLTFRGA